METMFRVHDKPKLSHFPTRIYLLSLGIHVSVDWVVRGFPNLNRGLTKTKPLRGFHQTYKKTGRFEARATHRNSVIGWSVYTLFIWDQII